MNILPKKKWHVRTKDNVARVRRDEAKAADEERRVKERAALAEQEHRTKILRERAALRNETVFGVRAAATAASRDQTSTGVDADSNDRADSFPVGSEVAIDQSGHVNFFAELEADERKNLGTTNKEHEEEKKQEKEAEEKKIGLLKYLGEGSSEYTKQVPWYQRVPEKPSASVSTSSIPGKKPTVERKPPVGIVGSAFSLQSTAGSEQQIVTPSDLKRAKRKLRKEKREREKEEKKEKKRKERKEKKSSKKRRRRSRSSSSSSSSSGSGSSSHSDVESPKVDLAQLRADRLRREAEERARADAVIRKARGLPDPQPVVETKQAYKQRYNSQFNPDIARQNRPE